MKLLETIKGIIIERIEDELRNREIKVGFPKRHRVAEAVQHSFTFTSSVTNIQKHCISIILSDLQHYGSECVYSLRFRKLENPFTGRTLYCLSYTMCK